jgi:hypothetical protein
MIGLNSPNPRVGTHYPLIHLPTHPLGFLGGWAVEKPRKTHFCVKIIDLFWKKNQFTLVL